MCTPRCHDDVIKWKHFPRHWPFVRGIHRSPVNSPHKGQWRGALMFSLIRVWINGWVNSGGAGDLRHYRAHYDVIVMLSVWLRGDASQLWCAALCGLKLITTSWTWLVNNRTVNDTVRDAPANFAFFYWCEIQIHLGIHMIYIPIFFTDTGTITLLLQPNEISF